MKNKELKMHIKFLKLLEQARAARNWTTLKIDDNLYVVGKKEQVQYFLESLQDGEEAPKLPEIPDETK